MDQGDTIKVSKDKGQHSSKVVKHPNEALHKERGGKLNDRCFKYLAEF